MLSNKLILITVVAAKKMFSSTNEIFQLPSEPGTSNLRKWKSVNSVMFLKNRFEKIVEKEKNVQTVLI